MATRRPKVPRADALGRQPQEKQHQDRQTQEKSDGGEVIRADFGGALHGSAGAAAAAGPSPSTARTTRSGGPAKDAGGKGRGTKDHAGKEHNTKHHGTKHHGAKNHGAKGHGSADRGHHDPVPAKAFSGRMLALAVVMIAITIMLAPTVRIFLEKRAEISALEAEIESKKTEQAELNKQLSRWQDPNYVKQQARDRINMVMPGETGYWVFGGDVPAGTPGGRTGSGASGNPANLPWVDALWESIRRSATD